MTITAEELRRMLRYSPETGVFEWAIKRKGRKLNSQAGSTMANGYKTIGVCGRDYLAHRLAWLYVHGELPAGHVDHINGDRADNRLVNLRVCNRSTNMQNVKRARVDSKTGLLGASPHKNRFIARITVGGKHRHLGLFDTAQEAHDAYLAAKRQYHAGNTL